MVDFQSRDTRRGPTTDDETEADEAERDEEVADDEEPTTQDARTPAETDAPADRTTDTPVRSVDVALVTVGDATDNGVEDVTAAAFESAGHNVTVRERLRGEYDGLQQAVDTLVGRDDVDVVVTAGGTGIGPDERTIEVVHPLLAKALPGFGEAFRSLLSETIGTGIVAVRSAAGISQGTLVFCLPGDPEAATVAVEELLVTEAPELVDHLQ